MHYRLYWLSDQTGRITRAEDLTAIDDAAALAMAREQAAPARFELWCGARLVHAADPIAPEA